MSAASLGLLAAFLLVLLALAYPIGSWTSRLSSGDLPTWILRLERPVYRLAGLLPARSAQSGPAPASPTAASSMNWWQYALALLVFNGLGVLALYALQRLQGVLPLNPTAMAAVAPDSAFNTAISFVSNTNWQGYSGEATMSHLTQMLGLTVQNFLSAASGIAVAFALIRGFAARSSGVIGNFWIDVTRITLWLLLPLSLLLSIAFVGQGVVQNLDGYKEVATLEAGVQHLAVGPVASQEAVKMLGTNGGGFFNANSAHPFENPTAVSNFLQMVAIFLIPAGLCFAFGRGVGDMRQGWALLGAMTVMFVLAVVAVTPAEQAGNPLLASLQIDQSASAFQSGGNMEGKETRFGIVASSLFAVVTTAASCGAVIAMHDSFTPLGGMVPLVLMQLGEVVFGGVGSGLYGMLVFAVLAVFIAGLMIGRTPEYLGKKVEAHEMKLIALSILVTPIVVLVGSAVAVAADAGQAGIGNPAAQGFSEIVYAFSSAGNNNGSAFAGLSANTPFYNTVLGIAMWAGRFGVILPVLAFAGALSSKKRLPPTAGTMPTHGPLFVALLVSTVLLVGLLNYVPALALGPVVEHLMLRSAK